MKFLKILAPLALVPMFYLGNVSANTIDARDIGLDTGSDADVTCNGEAGGACLGFDEPLGTPAVLSNTWAYNYPFQGNPTAELDYLNLLLDDLGRAPVTTVNKTDVEGNGFTTNLQYFSIKKGQNLWYFENTSGGALNVVWGQDDYSHWTEYGDAAVVPIPAAAWLFGSALLGLIGFKARAKRDDL